MEEILVNWKIRSYSFGSNVGLIAAKYCPQKRNFANSKKSFRFMAWKQWLLWPCSSWGLFSFRVKDNVQAGTSHLLVDPDDNFIYTKRKQLHRWVARFLHGSKCISVIRRWCSKEMYCHNREECSVNKGKNDDDFQIILYKIMKKNE